MINCLKRSALNIFLNRSTHLTFCGSFKTHQGFILEHFDWLGLTQGQVFAIRNKFQGDYKKMWFRTRNINLANVCKELRIKSRERENVERTLWQAESRTCLLFYLKGETARWSEMLCRRLCELSSSMQSPGGISWNSSENC